MKDKTTDLWSAEAASEFLTSKITKQAEIDGVSVSAVERRMIAFSPERPPSSELVDEFEKDYDRSEYDAKIARLAKAAYKSDRKLSPSDLPNWWTAIHTLECRDEENWILGHIRQAKLRRPGDAWRLLGAGSACVAIFLALASLGIHFSAPEWFGEALSVAFAVAVMLVWSLRTRTTGKIARTFIDLLRVVVMLPKVIFLFTLGWTRLIGRKLNRNRQKLT